MSSVQSAGFIIETGYKQCLKATIPKELTGKFLQKDQEAFENCLVRYFDSIS